MRSTFHVRITCGCRGLSILFDQSKIPASVGLASIVEIIDDSSSSIDVALRDQNLYRTRAARRDLRCNHAATRPEAKQRYRRAAQSSSEDQPVRRFHSNLRNT